MLQRKFDPTKFTNFNLLNFLNFNYVFTLLYQQYFCAQAYYMYVKSVQTGFRDHVSYGMSIGLSEIELKRVSPVLAKN